MKRSNLKPKRPRYPSRYELALRLDWEKEQSVCHVCRTNRGNQTHHIALRSAAPGRFESACNWLWNCDSCHSWLHRTGTNRHRVLLALKKLADPSNYDLDQWLWVVGKSDQEPPYVTEWEIQAALEMYDLIKR